MVTKRLLDEILDQTETDQIQRTNLESLNAMVQSLNTMANLFLIADKEIELNGGEPKIQEAFDDELGGLVTTAQDFVATSFDNVREVVEKVKESGEATGVIESIERLFGIEQKEDTDNTPSK